MSLRFSGMACCLLVLVGCSGGESGPPRYALSGSVTFDGKPVPTGAVYLEPDSSQENHGPTVTANIKDGKYELPSTRGSVGGPHLVRITGSDGVPTTLGQMEMPEGKSLFPDYKTEADLPASDTTLDFDVPAKK